MPLEPQGTAISGASKAPMSHFYPGSRCTCQDAAGDPRRGARRGHEGREGRPSRRRYRDGGEPCSRPDDVERRRAQHMEQARFRQADVARSPQVTAVHPLGNRPLDPGAGRLLRLERVRRLTRARRHPGSAACCSRGRIMRARGRGDWTHCARSGQTRQSAGATRMVMTAWPALFLAGFQIVLTFPRGHVARWASQSTTP